MATERDRSRCRERVVTLARSRLSSADLRVEAIGVLQRTIGFDGWCWPLGDPGSALHCAGFGSEMLGSLDLPRMILLEQTGDPVNAMPILAQSQHVGGILSEATGGDLASSARWDQGMRAAGVGDEMRVALVDAAGLWGFIDMLRDGCGPPFAEQDVRLLEWLAPVLATALRHRAVQDPDVPEGPAPEGAGVVILDEDLRIRSWTPAARAWLDRLVPAGQPAFLGDAVVYGVAGRLLALRRGAATHPGDRVRVRTLSGHWAVVESAGLEGDDTGSIAVSIRPAGSDELLDLVCSAYGLSARECELVALLIAGLDTTALSRAMFISRHTVQDHLKSVFAKVGVRTRRELVAKLTTALRPAA